MKGEMRIRRLVKSLSYKPGSTMTVKRYKGNHNALRFYVTLEVIDSDPPHSTYTVDGNWKLDPEWIGSQTDGQIIASLMVCVAMIELHEVYEHFMVDGKRFMEPHPERRSSGKIPKAVCDAFCEEVFGGSK